MQTCTAAYTILHICLDVLDSYFAPPGTRPCNGAAHLEGFGPATGLLAFEGFG